MNHTIYIIVHKSVYNFTRWISSTTRVSLLSSRLVHLIMLPNFLVLLAGHDVKLQHIFHKFHIFHCDWWPVLADVLWDDQSVILYHSYICVYVRIMIVSCLATFLGTNSLSVLIYREAVNRSMMLSIAQLYTGHTDKLVKVIFKCMFEIVTESCVLEINVYLV